MPAIARNVTDTGAIDAGAIRELGASFTLGAVTVVTPLLQKHFHNVSDVGVRVSVGDDRDVLDSDDHSVSDLRLDHNSPATNPSSPVTLSSASTSSAPPPSSSSPASALSSSLSSFSLTSMSASSHPSSHIGIANLVAASAEDLSHLPDITFDTVFDDDADYSYGSPVPFDASEHGLWNGRFVPPPPRPPFFVQDEPVELSDGLATCDLCSWAMPTKSTFIFDGTIEKATELGWPLAVIIVSVISALLGAIIMVTVVRCRRRKTSTHRTGKSVPTIKHLPPSPTPLSSTTTTTSASAQSSIIPYSVENVPLPTAMQSSHSFNTYTQQHHPSELTTRQQRPPLPLYDSQYETAAYATHRTVVEHSQQHQKRDLQQQQQQQQQQRDSAHYYQATNYSCSSSSLTNDSSSTNQTSLSSMSYARPPSCDSFYNHQRRDHRDHQLKTVAGASSSTPSKTTGCSVNMLTRPLPPKPSERTSTYSDTAAPVVVAAAAAAAVVAAADVGDIATIAMAAG